MKRFFKKLVGILVVALLVIAMVPANSSNAATNKLNKTKATIEVGKTVKLQLKNAKASKVKWKSSDKKIAKVSSKGVVTGVKSGSTKIVATYQNKKYTCKVTVKAGKLTFSSIKVGDTITFGSYEQDGNSGNGKEPVKWVVLDKNKSKQGLFLISSEALDCRPYHYRWAGTTWKDCTLRTWLNKDFYDACFDAKEQASIMTTKVTPDANPNAITKVNYGSATNDKVYLLSIKELDKYIPNKDDRLCKATKYANSKSKNLTKAGEKYCGWGLRTQGAAGGSYVSYVDREGELTYNNADAEFVGVRPVIWVKFNSEVITK